MIKQVLIVLCATISFMAVWLGVFKFSYSNSRTRNSIAMMISSHTRIPVSYSFSIFATIFYSGMPLLAAIVFSKVFNFHFADLFKQYHGPLAIPVDIVMGELAVLAIDSVPLVLLSVLSPKVRIDKEMQDINWISGISKIPGKWSMMIPCISACCEELFFRGVLFGILIQANMTIWSAAIIVTFLFIVNQVLLTKRPVQALVLGASSFAISIVSCLLIGVSGNIIPSFVIHASFAGFYANNKS